MNVKLVNQPTSETGCGVACFAMVQNYTDYETAFSEMQKNGHVLQNGNVQIKQMQSALAHRDTKLNNSEPQNEATCLLFVVYKGKYRHWVVRHEGLYYDPLPQYKRPRKNIKYKVTRAISLLDDSGR